MKILWVSPFLPKSDAAHAGGRALAQWIDWTAARHAVTLRVPPRAGRAGRRRRPGARAWPGCTSQSSSGRTARWPSAPHRGLLRAARPAANRLLRSGPLRPPPRRVPRDRPRPRAARAGAQARGGHRRAGASPRATGWSWPGARARGGRVAVLAGHRPRCSAASAASSTASSPCPSTTVARCLPRDPTLSLGVLPFPVGIDTTRRRPARARTRSLLFVGAMHRDANVDAVRHFAGTCCRACAPRCRR